ncbi:hypothetical protein T09_1837 [Trichinella sp. T9]|nr:hypothetical protein T09_1837 [Trichinella sp. T9]
MQYSIQVLYLVNLRTGPQLWVGAPGKIPYRVATVVDPVGIRAIKGVNIF